MLLFLQKTFYKDDNKKVLQQPMIKFQTNQSQQRQQCQQCKETSTSLIRLGCNHSFCIKCLAFSYHKFSSSMSKPTLTRCKHCQRTIELSDHDLHAINEFTNHVLVPLIQQEGQKQNGHAKNQNQYQLSNNSMSSSNKQFKSHDQSTQKVTPLGKGFYSRCDSPKSGFNQTFCQVHPEQQLSIICFSCNNALLCISCFALKKHTSHNIKTITKGLQTIQEQISLSRLKGREFIDGLEIAKRRLEDRRAIVQERWDRTTNSLRLHFNNLLDLVNKKCEEILENYSNFFEKNMEDVVRDGVKVDQALRHTKRQLEKLADLSKLQANPIDVIKKSTQLMEEISELKDPQTEICDLNYCDSDRVVREVVHICEKVERINPYWGKQNLKTHGVDNYKSQEKINKQNYFKRVKTNVMSLNSSRDKKEKKCTKTQQDEKRNKSKANYKAESSSKLIKVNKALPAYLLQHLDKQCKDSPLPQCLMDMNPLQSSFKSTSKLLSKSHIPSAADQHKRKKEHIAYIKECMQRKQRKTFNGTSKQISRTTQVMRKKKIPS